MEGAARASGLPPGTRLGRYTLLRRLAVGGMAELYIAHQRGAAGFTKIVALKRILPHLAEDPTFTRMFLDEARLASGLDHANLAHVLDFGEYDGEHFLTMEYVHGRNLLQLLRGMSERALPLASSLAIVTQVARGLHDLHEQRSPDGRALGLVHRDVSPSNVLLSFDGKVKLTDFGIAKAMELTSATRSGTFKGKLGHSSPEQVRGEEIDRRSDVFCLGILLYEATTGARAFSGPNEFAVLGKVARGDYVAPDEIAPDYPPPLAAIVAKALSIEPEDRYGTAASVADAIDDYARQADLRLTSEAIAETMREVFGPAPPIVVEQELELASKVDMPTVVAPGPITSTGVRPRRTGTLAWALPLAVAVAAGGAFALGRASTPETPAETVEPVVPSEPVVIQAPVVVPTPVPAAPTETEALEPEPEPEPSAEPVVTDIAPPPEPAPAKRPRSKRPRKRRDRKEPAKPELGGLYPPE